MARVQRAVEPTDSQALSVVANRLPVERLDADSPWKTSPGGLVSALVPVLQSRSGVWVGWAGAAGEQVEPFEFERMSLQPVDLSRSEIEQYYEGFSNATLWPLYHDVTGEAIFDRGWWESYVRVNERFAEAASRSATLGSTVWVHDYQLQLVPAMLRRARPDLRVGWFDHIPFPGYEIYARLPWRDQIVAGLLGADLLGFQRRDDAANFLRAARRCADVVTRGSMVKYQDRLIRVGAFPISVDTRALDRLAREPATHARAAQIRADLGDPEVVLLGVDRLDYTKGIVNRLRAYAELLDEGVVAPPRIILVQVASPSRNQVREYQLLRDELETLVGRINGDYSSVGHPAVHYLHQSFPKEEMAAMYLAADVMLVTPLKDGMNLVAKEYVACRHDDGGALVLSEFTGAADDLRQAIMVNPWDIDAMKLAIRQALDQPRMVSRRKMRAMRNHIFTEDVHHWAAAFLGALGLTVEQAQG